MYFYFVSSRYKNEKTIGGILESDIYMIYERLQFIFGRTDALQV